MDLLLYFSFGFVASVIGVAPPGLLNMTAAKISLKENPKNAFLFSLGVITTVALQTYIALLFARYLDRHPEVISLLQKVGLGIFICLTGYYFFLAKNQKIPKHYINKSKSSRYFHGFFLSFLNLFPLPYWVYMSITFSAFGWFGFTKPFIALCVLGSALGSLTMLVLYAHFFKNAQRKKKELKLNINYIIGTITAIISVITLLKIINDLY